jgi:hypothetical protein
MPNQCFIGIEWFGPVRLVKICISSTPTWLPTSSMTSVSPTAEKRLFLMPDEMHCVNRDAIENRATHY